QAARNNPVDVIVFDQQDAQAREGACLGLRGHFAHGGLGLGQRQYEAKRAALANLGLDRELPAELRHQGPADVEAQPGAA
nr:hypothetical protein [Tanacetum cinerariifolium]